MSERHVAPTTIRRRFCPTCGLLVPSAHNPHWHRAEGRRCPGTTVILTYRLVER